MAPKRPPDLVFNEPVATGWARVEVYGDRDYGRRFVQSGRALLGTMRSIYGVNERIADGQGGGFYHQWARLADGTLLQAISNDGQDTIRIFAQDPRRALERKHKKKLRPWGKLTKVLGVIAGIDQSKEVNWSGVWDTISNYEMVSQPPGSEQYGFDLYAISGNGMYLGGGMYTLDADIAIILGPQGWQEVPVPNTYAQNWTSGFSDDGHVAVGASFNLSIGAAAWRWVRGQDVEILGGLYNTSLYPCISPNGRWIVRTDGTNINWEAHVHYDGVHIASLPVGVAVLAISDTGVAVGCQSGSQAGGRYFHNGMAVMWDAGNGITTIGGAFSQANDIAHDGSMIVGHDGYPPGGYGDAWVWTPEGGRQSLAVIGAPWAIAVPNFPPNPNAELKLVIDPQEKVLCGMRHAGSEIVTATSGASYPWNATDLQEVQDGTSTVITLVPITQLGQANWYPYNPDEWPENGPLIPLVWRYNSSITDPQPADNTVFGTVERDDFQQATWRAAVVFYPSYSPGSTATSRVHRSQGVLWDKDLAMHDLADCTQATDLALPVAEVELPEFESTEPDFSAGAPR